MQFWLLELLFTKKWLGLSTLEPLIMFYKNKYLLHFTSIIKRFRIFLSAKNGEMALPIAIENIGSEMTTRHDFVGFDFTWIYN